MISILGSGKVGSAIAFLIASNSLDDIILVNRTKEKAIGESLDIANAIPENSDISILGTDDYSKTEGSEIVVITASAGTYTQSRTEILKDQIEMIRDISQKIKKFTPESKILVVSNPPDVLTYFFQKFSNFPSKKIIGIASSLDSRRFELLLSRELKVKQSQIKNSLVMGEHGNSMVPIFSIAKLNNSPILEVLDNSQIENITKDLRNYWKTLREFKSRSVFGISKNTYDVINSIICNNPISIPASVLLNGEYGIFDVCIGVPVRISKNGISDIKEIQISKEELEFVHASANTVKSQIQMY